MHVPSLHACIYGIQATQPLALSVSITARAKQEHCQPLNIISSSILLLTLMSDLAPTVCLPLGKNEFFSTQSARRQGLPACSMCNLEWKQPLADKKRLTRNNFNHWRSNQDLSLTYSRSRRSESIAHTG